MIHNVKNLLFKIKQNIEESLLDIYSNKTHHTRLFSYFVSSEDIKTDCGADSIFYERQIGYGGMIQKGDKWIGYIEEYQGYLGDDPIIKFVKIYNNEKLSKEMTEKYKNKILICSSNKDYFNS